MLFIMMATQTQNFKPESLKAGLLIKDVGCGDLGVLVKRYDILNDFCEKDEKIWVWDIYWTGSATTEDNRHTTLVEKAILTLLSMGAWCIQTDHDH